MSRLFRNITFPPTYKYSSDSEHIPLEFYNDVFPVSKKIDLLLGYFSSNAIKVLSKSFAEFVFNGGQIRIVTNHILSLKDKENLIDKNGLIENEDHVINIFGDIEKLENELSDYGQHFFDCLKFLQKEKRLEIRPVKFNGIDLAHCKKMILFDGADYISTDGSINFTLSALTKNSESFEVNAPWEGEIFEKRTSQERENFNLIFEGKHPSYQYLDSKDIETVIYKVGKNKELQDLLEDSIKIDDSSFGDKVKAIFEKKKDRFKHIVNDLKGLPRFPYPTGARPYQIEAFNNWKSNNYSGVFAMATGTGKTITSLNCVLIEYQTSGNYRVLILVPSIALLNQWELEVKGFNFSRILKVGGGNNWELTLGKYVSDSTWGIKGDLVIISTYGSFVTDKFQKYFCKIQSDFTLIADEAHNMGANNIKKQLDRINVQKKIGLSATPKRIYDLEGTNAIDNFFNDSPPYVYSFNMERALNEGFLTEYKYYPILVELTENELKEYIEISQKLLKFFDFEKGEFKKDPIVEILLLKRKSIIHKAHNKISSFKSILKELQKEDKLKYVFTYIPEGYVNNSEGESEKLLNEFIRAGAETIPGLKMNSYTSEDDGLKDILRGFSEGKINLLFAMKMLDEGVDVPRAEVGVFCSSTGNPRQFIQRRGRLLRKHNDKAFATIYDMVVVPRIYDSNEEYYSMEKNMVKNELQRVAYFASLSMNYYDSRDNLVNVCEKYDLNLDQIIEEL
jgi:superfamily II DNA or RNA helicase